MKILLEIFVFDLGKVKNQKAQGSVKLIKEQCRLHMMKYSLSQRNPTGVAISQRH